MSFPKIIELVPHDPPMIVLDEIVSWQSPKVICRAQLRSDCMFLRGESMPGYAVIEYLAQAIGCAASLLARESKLQSDRPKVGFVLGSRELEIHREHFLVGEVLDIHAEHVFGDQQLGSFKTSAYVGAELVACGCINVFASQELKDLP